MFQILEQQKENKLLEQLVGLFLLPKEMSKVRACPVDVWCGAAIPSDGERGCVCFATSSGTHVYNRHGHRASARALLIACDSPRAPCPVMPQVWERAVYNEDEEVWVLPTIKPRPGFSQVVKLPGIMGGRNTPEPLGPKPSSAAGGAYVSDGDDVITHGGGIAMRGPAASKSRGRSPDVSSRDPPASVRGGGTRDGDADRRQRKAERAERRAFRRSSVRLGYFVSAATSAA